MITKETMTFSAVDCESIEGKAVLVCSPKRDLIYPTSFEQIIGKLFTIKAEEAHHIFTFNLNYDALCIFKFLPDDVLKELYNTNEVEYNGYKIMYIGGKFLGISKGGNKITLVDASPFFHTSLDKAAENYLGKNKIGGGTELCKTVFKSTPETREKGIIDSFKFKQRLWSPETLYRWLEDHKEIITKYCKEDANLTAELGKIIDKACAEGFGFRIETYSSTAKIGEKATLRHCLIPDKSLTLNKDGSQKMWAAYPRTEENSRIAQYAKASVRGGLFATLQKGRFEEVTDLDINSAYPYIMQNLPHWANGSFVELTEEMIQDIESGKIHPEYGWIGATFDCFWIPYDSQAKEVFMSLYPSGKNGELEEYVNELKYNKILYVTGEREQIITLEEYYFMKKHGFSCHLENGFVWMRKEGKEGQKYVEPFGWIPLISKKKGELKVYLKKNKIDKKTSLLYEMYKIGMNGSYGKTIQSKGRGTLINPFYGSYITARCRLKICEFVIENNLKDKIIAFATDGILIEGNYPMKGDDELGGWEVNHYDEAFVLGNGMLQLTKIKYGKLHPQEQNKYCLIKPLSLNNIESIEVNSRMRGISANQKLDVKHQLQHTPKQMKKIYTKIRPIHLGEAILHNKLMSEHFGFKSVADALNVFVPYARALQVNADKSGKWKQLDCFDDLMRENYRKEFWSVEEYEAEKLKPKKERRI